MTMQVQSSVQAEAFQAVMGVILAVWMGTFVLSQVIKTFKGETVEKPPLLGSVKGVVKK